MWNYAKDVDRARYVDEGKNKDVNRARYVDEGKNKDVDRARYVDEGKNKDVDRARYGDEGKNQHRFVSYEHIPLPVRDHAWRTTAETRRQLELNYATQVASSTNVNKWRR